MTAHSQTLGLLKGQLGFLQQSLDVIMVAKDTGNLVSLAKQEGVEYRDIDIHREISIFADLKSLYRLIALFRKEKPDIVHANTPKGALLGLLAAWFCRVPYRIYNVNGLRFETATGNLRRILVYMERIACACANKVIPQSNGVAEILRKEKITSKPLKVILNGSGNGVDIDFFDPTNEDVLSKGKAIRGEFNGVSFVFVGRLVGDKGVNELVAAFDKLSKAYDNVRLYLVGRKEAELDPLQSESEEIIKHNEKIVAVGDVLDVRPFLSASNVFVLPSYREGFPNVVLEAAAMGLPCIVTDVNGAKDAIQNGVNGYIIPKRDSDALYFAMKKLCVDISLRYQMAKTTRSFIASHFNRPDVWNATLDMYQDLIGK
jgi:glycosyltransferase involved in cell wall biosynthesis